MLEKLIYKIRCKIFVKNIINVALLFLPLITFSILQLGYSPIWIIPLLIIIMLYIIYNVQKYRDMKLIDKTLKLNNVVSTYYEYKDSNNPFVAKLTLKAQNELKSVNPTLFPKFETISIPLILSLFIISIYISRQKTDMSNSSTKNHPKNSNINNNQSNQTINKNINRQNNTKKSIPQNTDSNINILKQNNGTERKNIPILIKNNISKDEKKIIESITYESYYGR